MHDARLVIRGRVSTGLTFAHVAAASSHVGPSASIETLTVAALRHLHESRAR